MELWKFEKNFPPIRAVYDRISRMMIRFASLSRLLFDPFFTSKRNNLSEWNTLFYLMEPRYLKRSDKKQKRREFFDYFIRQAVYKYLDQVLTEIILNDKIFVFPGNKMYLFVGSTRLRSRYGQMVSVFLVTTPSKTLSKEKPSFRVMLLGKYKKMLVDELKKGHQYVYYETIINDIQYEYQKNLLQRQLRVARGNLGKHSK